MKTEEVCRTCLTDEGDFVSILSVMENNTISQMLTDLTSLEISLSDGLTQSICSECVKETENAHKFRTKCIKSSESLLQQNVLKQNSTTVDVSFLNKIKEERLDIPFEEEENQDSQFSEIKIKIEVDDEEDYANDDNGDEEGEYEGTGENKISKKSKSSVNNENHIIFQCPLCHGLLASENVYERHIKELHADDPRCQEQRLPRGLVIREVGGSKPKYKCVEDDFIGKTMVEFRNHMKEHLGEKYIMCSDCNYKTTAISLLRTHKTRVHSELNPFSCPECDYKCKTKTNLVKHSACHSTEKKYKCKLCPVAFKHPSSLSLHKKEKHDYACKVCHEAFSDGIELKKHIATHPKEKPHVCEVCGLSFTKRSVMKYHVALRHEPPKELTEVFKCTDCDYSTKKKALFLRHVKYHGERKFKCDQCSFQTVKKSSLQIHLAKHSGEARYFCEVCDYKSYNKYTLVMHRRLHTGEKPFACSICSFTCRHNQALRLHMQTHSSDQIYACPNCPYRTNVQTCLQRHKKKKCVSKKRGRPLSKEMPSSSTANTMVNDVKDE